MFYFGICSGGSSSEYITMAKTLCKEYPELKDKKPVIEGEYWVSNVESGRYAHALISPHCKCLTKVCAYKRAV